MTRITVIWKKETFLESLGKDLTTFAFLILCIWFSNDQGGGWWTFFTASMFLLFLSGKIALSSSDVVKLKTKAEALKWVENLPEDGGAA